MIVLLHATTAVAAADAFAAAAVATVVAFVAAAATSTEFQINFYLASQVATEL